MGFAVASAVVASVAKYQNGKLRKDVAVATTYDHRSVSANELTSEIVE